MIEQISKKYDLALRLSHEGKLRSKGCTGRAVTRGFWARIHKLHKENQKPAWDTQASALLCSEVWSGRGQSQVGLAVFSREASASKLPACRFSIMKTRPEWRKSAVFHGQDTHGKDREPSWLTQLFFTPRSSFLLIRFHTRHPPLSGHPSELIWPRRAGNQTRFRAYQIKIMDELHFTLLLPGEMLG